MKQVNLLLKRNFDLMQATGNLFVSAISGREVWKKYLEGMEPDPILRVNGEHDCQTCHHFVNAFGNIVALDNNCDIMTIWDNIELEEYKRAAELCSQMLKQAKIKSVFRTSMEDLNEACYEVDDDGNRIAPKKQQNDFALGISHNLKMYTHAEAEGYPRITSGKVYIFEHLHLRVNKKFVEMYSTTATAIGTTSMLKQVFSGLMREVLPETFQRVLNGFKLGELLRPEDNIGKLEKLLTLSTEYAEVSSSKEDNWLWANLSKYPMLGGSVRELITMVNDNDSNAFDSYNRMVDPANYMRQQKLASQRQVEQAKKDFEEQGYMESFTRRCATLDDIEPELIEHLQNTEASKMSIFDQVPTADSKPLNLEHVPSITFEQFQKLVPKSSSIELYMENRLVPNLVSLTTAVNKESKRIFKWNNNFAWTYNGGLAGVSHITTAVKQAGGFVEAPFRFSILWNDSETPGDSDFDAHCIDADGSHIYYSAVQWRKDRNGKPNSTGCMQDLDCIRPNGRIGVENIFWQDLNYLSDGTYKFYVHLYSDRGNRGFKAEILFKGKTWTFFVNRRMARGETVTLGTITIENKEIVKLDLNEAHLVSSNNTLKTKVWGISTNIFNTVTLMCVSPNYWHEKTGVKEHFFFLKDCQADGPIKAFHVEHLNSELMKHKRVLDFLPATCESTEGQLSGVGFNSTTSNYAYFRIDGKRIYKVNI